MSTGPQTDNTGFMLVRKTDYRRFRVADAIVQYLLDNEGGDLRVMTHAGIAPLPCRARCLAREWLALGGCPAGERERDPAREAVPR